jgi:hypothetical protein
MGIVTLLTEMWRGVGEQHEKKKEESSLDERARKFFAAQEIDILKSPWAQVRMAQIIFTKNRQDDPKTVNALNEALWGYETYQKSLGDESYMIGVSSFSGMFRSKEHTAQLLSEGKKLSKEELQKTVTVSTSSLTL